MVPQILTMPQDARYTSLHFTPGHLLSLSFDDPPESGWSVMPGFDESIPVPAHLEPPRLDADETLPSQLHPSYPFGRPPSLGRPVRPWMGGPGNLLGTVGDGQGRGQGMEGGMGGVWMGGRWGRGEGWEELGLTEVVEVEERKEVPPGMAVSVLLLDYSHLPHETLVRLVTRACDSGRQTSPLTPLTCPPTLSPPPTPLDTPPTPIRTPTTGYPAHSDRPV